jgi:hypothetical protein
MEFTKAQELIRQLKEAKSRNEITYPRLIEMLDRIGKPVSLTTLRRVFADGSESNAGSFSYEHTLIPIAEALLNVEDVPSAHDSPEIDGLKAVIHVQNEEIARLHELKDHLESRITFFLVQLYKKRPQTDRRRLGLVWVIFGLTKALCRIGRCA